MNTYQTENRAFNEMNKAAKLRLQGRIPQDIALKTGFVFNEKTSLFTITALNKEVYLSYPKFDFITDINDWYKLIILHYMDNADLTPAGTGIITFSELTDGLVRGSGLDRLCENDIRNFWGNQTIDFLNMTAQKTGGEIIKSNADFCAQFRFLPKVILTLKIWLKDDELSGSGRMFLSQNADTFLSVEDAVTLGELLLNMLHSNADT